MMDSSPHSLGDGILSAMAFLPLTTTSIENRTTTLILHQRLAWLAALLAAIIVFASFGSGRTPKLADRLDDHDNIHQSIHSANVGLTATPTATATITVTVADLLAKLVGARQELDQRLKDGYGPYYYPMFYNNADSDDANTSKKGVSRGRRAFISGHQGSDTNNNISQHRFQRKLQLKILERILLTMTTTTTATATPPKLVWVTGGHSAAAGHGNLYDESTTAIFETAVAPAFAALGIDLETRNYAMGGMCHLFIFCCGCMYCF
jgi:hypothetical protein